MGLVLRQWQTESVEKLVSQCKKGKKQFFCLAATATGKTVMAAESAKRLLELDKVDIVIAFCPSNEIQLGIKRTLSRHLGLAFDGSLKAKGSVHTYQGMLTLDKAFWALFNTYRVMVIFDEIHHCAGTEFSRKNAWGSQILNFIMENAAFVLCLSGTPWRSDMLPITAACYDQEGKINCDYQYGLSAAVKDGVCRNPSLVLLDNSQVLVNLPSGVKSFGSLAEAIKDSPLDYIKVIRDPKSQKYLIGKAVDKLREIRIINRAAGGIVVASSIEHAETIADLLRNQFGETALVVSYLHPKAQQTIDQFRHSDVSWIVSVGMISEGTDLPRAQVCCHLSHIRTEMHFRQTLGRILRINQAQNQEAWFYTFAEASLSVFAKRLQIDLPEATVKFENMDEGEKDQSRESEKKDSANDTEEQEDPFDFDLSSGGFDDDEDADTPETGELDEEENERAFMHFELNEAFFVEQLVCLYDLEEQCGG